MPRKATKHFLRVLPFPPPQTCRVNDTSAAATGRVRLAAGVVLLLSYRASLGGTPPPPVTGTAPGIVPESYLESLPAALDAAHFG